jgi:hypothetical protein
MRYQHIGKRITVIIMLGIGLWLLWPGRNVAGNPQFETLINKCLAGQGEHVRLYEGNGGATSAYWYSATIEDPGMFSRERQFFFSYSSPIIEQAMCKGTIVELVGPEQSLSFSLEKIHTELVDTPVNLYRGQPGKMTNGFTMVTIPLGILFLIVGFSLVFWRANKSVD